jgi:hypothetical protein
MNDLERVEGSLYFTLDTKKIFLDRGENQELLQMCGSRGLFYGTKAIRYIDNGEDPKPEVVFNINDIENGEYPEINDLILNIGT